MLLYMTCRAVLEVSTLVAYQVRRLHIHISRSSLPGADGRLECDMACAHAAILAQTWLQFWEERVSPQPCLRKSCSHLLIQL